MIELHPAPVPCGYDIPATAHIGVPPASDRAAFMRWLIAEPFDQIFFPEGVIPIFRHENVVQREVVSCDYCASKKNELVVVMDDVYLVL